MTGVMRKRSVFRRIATGTAMSVAAILIAGCGGGGSGAQPSSGEPSGSAGEMPDAPAGEKTITLVVGIEPSGLDGVAGSTVEQNIGQSIFENLMVRGKDGTPLPGLVESWEASPDKTEWTFKLQPEANFSNGEPVTAEAVKFSIERFLAPDFTSSRKSYYPEGFLKDIVVVDDKTVRFEFNRPNATMLTQLVYESIVPPQYYSEVGNEQFIQAPIGAGAYKFVEWDRGHSLTLEANENYWRGKPEYDRVIYRFVADESARAAAVLSGDADVAGPISVDQVDLINQTSGVHIAAAPFSIERDRLMFRWDKPPFDDVRVREAVNLAIDRETIVETILRGYGDVTNGPSVRGEWGWTAEDEIANAWPYDPERAKELMVEAGYGDGVTITFDTRPGLYPKDDEWPVAIAEYLKAIGITVNIVPNDGATMLKKLQEKTGGEMAQGLMVGGGNFHVFHSYNIFLNCTTGSPVYNPKDEDGHGIYGCDPQLDEYAQEAFAAYATDEAKSQELYSRAFARAKEVAISAFLWTYRQPYAIRDGVDWEPMPSGFYVVGHS